LKSWIRKDSEGEIKECLSCTWLLNYKVEDYVVVVECTAQDRFDCPRLRAFYTDDELVAAEEWKRRHGIA
jgi:hypothetical protein